MEGVNWRSVIPSINCALTGGGFGFRVRSPIPLSSAACEYFYGAPCRDAVTVVIETILVAILVAQVIPYRE
jgi:hypothetical protein